MDWESKRGLEREGTREPPLYQEGDELLEKGDTGFRLALRDETV